MDAVTLATIEQAAKQFSKSHAELATVVSELNEAVDALKRIRMPGIKRAVAKAKEHKHDLEVLVDAARSLFVKPRTVIFHGIKVGLQKGKGGIAIDDPEKTIVLIKRHFDKDVWELLIRTVESPDKDGIAKLTVDDLKRIGCKVKDTDDKIVIAPTDSEVDKIVSALLAEDEEAA